MLLMLTIITAVINRRNLLLTLIPLFWILCKDYEGVNGDTKTFVKQYNI